MAQGHGFESLLRQNGPRLGWDPWAGRRAPNCSPGAASSAAHCSGCGCTWMGRVQRTHFLLLIILRIIVYVTMTNSPSSITLDKLTNH